MIASLTGIVVEVGTSTTTIAVAGVGLSIRATPETLAKLRVGGEATLYTTLVVREDSLTLYGFGGPTERDLFELLQTAGGVGPRLAQAALAVHPPETVRHAIASGDIATLTRIPGVGKKGAERLVLELKDKIGALPGSAAIGSRVGRPSSWRDQVQQGLVGLGWSAKDAGAAIVKLDSQVDGEAVDIQDLLKRAIRLLGTK